MERCHQHGIRLNREKAELHKSEITFLGDVIANNGLKPDANKTEAIVKMKAPTCVKEIQSFSGMINYLPKFMPRLSDMMVPIHQLLHKDKE